MSSVLTNWDLFKQFLKVASNGVSVLLGDRTDIVAMELCNGLGLSALLQENRWGEGAGVRMRNLAKDSGKK